jgi:chromosome transmission fidelity protein 18
MYLKRTAHQEIADTLRNSLPLGIKELFTGPNIVSELAPLLMRVLTPDLKPVNQQLIRSEDRLALKKLVKIMLDLNLTFVQDKNEDGQIVYKLDPPMDVFVHYEGKRASDVPPARFNLRQLISRELEAEALRRAGGGEAASISTGKQAGDIINAYKKPETNGQPKTAKEAAVSRQSHDVPDMVTYARTYRRQRISLAVQS